MDINIAVTDANNITLEVTPTPTQTITIDRGIAGPQGPAGPAGGGDVTGPASSTDNAIARFNGTTGKLIQNSAVTIGDSGNTIISVTDNTNAALRITQLGTGNALLVEDSTNPDATPFVVDANGRVISGALVPYSINTITGRIQAQSTSVFDGGFQSTLWSADNNPTIISFGKSRGASVGTQTIVNSADAIGVLQFAGSDGTQFVEAARIIAAVDGDPGTNDMPGRLVFSTTANGASSPTERMRIDNAGNVGIGGTAIAGQSIAARKNVTGATTSWSIISYPSIQSDVTSIAGMFYSQPATQATTFTLTSLYHFNATQGTFGLGSTVTNQYGFFVNSANTGATNNYGFYGNIASGANRWNLYMNGTADNYMAGSLGIGTTPSTGTSLQVSKTITGATNSFGIVNNGIVQSDVTSSAQGIRSALGTAAATFTTTDLYQVIATQGTFGLNSVVTNQYGFHASSALTGGTNNYGFYGNIASGANRYNLYMAGTADNYMAGSLGIGTVGLTDRLLAISKTANAVTTSLGVMVETTYPATVTNGQGYTTSLSTGSGATLSFLQHFRAQQATLTGTVTDQYGFHAAGSLTGASNNYGFYGNIASGTGRWNLFMNGTANNYMGGRLGIGTTGLTDSLVPCAINPTGATTIYGFRQIGTVQSDVTANWIPFQSAVSTAAAAFTLSGIQHFLAGQGTFGATSAVTNQYGFVAQSTLTGATNNYGFFGAIASGANRYNLYMQGTAANFLGGQLQLGQDYIEKTNVANTSTAITLDLTNGTFQVLTLTGSPTITMPTAVAGKSFVILLKTGTGSFTVTWSTVKWPGGTAPTITSTASKQDIFSFFSDGTNWYGTTVGQNYTP